ncbi:alpha/beta-hydrolase [Ascodesmis nigricans]|uniref:Alpha/beta-hydrolase n=1 Tax=Ascodesmis nigricans TaxID=341454 RepID=A0A4S2N4A2_9PEZI|nr:alpha/beta-hydrolase [Ascodesmis nigricans]
MVALQSIFIKAYWSLAALGTLYFLCLAALIHPTAQNYAIYMHKLQLTWFHDLTIPEQFGFAKNQVTPFFIPTPDGERLFAWHVLPLGLYSSHRDPLIQQPTGVSSSPTSTENLRLLTSDPDSHLIIHFHGNAGTVGAAIRPGYLRSLSAAQPSKIHILTIDYRGFGLSSGSPSEEGLITDGLTVVDYALNELNIPPERISLVGQSLGTAVTFAVADRLIDRTPPIEPKAIISIAGFSDMEEIVRTYRAGGVFPILRPLRTYPFLVGWFLQFLRESWDSKTRIAEIVRKSGKANLVLVHAKNDYEIPHDHLETLWISAINATVEGGVSKEWVAENVKTEVFGDESSVSVWQKGEKRIAKHVVNWGGHNNVVSAAGTSVLVAKALGF